MPDQGTKQETVRVGDITLNVSKSTLKRNGTEIHLTPKETKLMRLLMQNVGKVVSRSELMQAVWNTEYLGDTRTLDVHICWLRQKIEDNPRIPELILTRRGQGYELRV
jgi:two-component system alkaline phosphatase synthesis response regulator PhoP